MVVLLVVSCVGTSSLPRTSGRQRRALVLQQAPSNEFNVLHANGSSICLRLAASISILVQYRTERIRDGAVQVIVPRLKNENVEGSCGPDAFLHLSWTSSDAATTSPTGEEANVLNVEEAAGLEPTAFLDANTNSLHFQFVQQNDLYFIANITGSINIDNVPVDYSPSSNVVEVSITGQKLLEAPVGVVSMCDGETLVSGKAQGNISAVTLFLGDVQLLAYYQDSYWPNQVRSCRSSPVLETDDTVAIVLGTLAAVVGAGLLGAFIYYLRMR